MLAALDTARLRDLLEAEGFEVPDIVEVRSGGPPVFAAANIVTFVVDHLDDVLIPILSGVVINWLTKGPMRRMLGDRGAKFSVKEAKDLRHQVIVNVNGDGNWVQVYPRPKPDEEE